MSRHMEYGIWPGSPSKMRHSSAQFVDFLYIYKHVHYLPSIISNYKTIQPSIDLSTFYLYMRYIQSTEESSNTQITPTCSSSNILDCLVYCYDILHVRTSHHPTTMYVLAGLEISSSGQRTVLGDQVRMVFGCCARVLYACTSKLS